MSRDKSSPESLTDCLIVVCIGMHFAQLELRYALASFYRAFPAGVKPAFVEGFTEDDMLQTSYFITPPKGKRCLVMPRK